ncbi:MAG: PDZ domain-containing protein [Campylobacterota bacterium]|nr:PDZ domain-containing protein [Campylobacterota bacterium]
MKHLFSLKSIKNLWWIVVLLLCIKLLWSVVAFMWLPVSGINYLVEKERKPLYYRVKLNPNKTPAPVKKKVPTKVISGDVKDIKLLAIYSASDMAVITIEYKKKTKVLGKGDEVNGFILDSAGNNFAIFSKGIKTYKINLFKPKKGSSSKGKGSIKEVASLPSPVKSTKPVGDVIDAGDHKIVDRSLLDHYGENVENVYKDIGIKDIKKGKDLEGFSVSFIRRGSPFAKLGLKRGDVISSINGQKIDSYSAAFGIYKNIKDIENLTLVIKRGKEEMELEYEVN